MNNNDFLKILEKSYQVYLNTSPRSNKKLVVLHGEIAKDLQNRLGKDYEVKSLGIGKGKEAKISGRYLEKNVDISIFKDKEALGGIAVKYIMSNYSQNTNNYFENMLGETANLRASDKAYFQIIILPQHLPYFKKDGTISRIEVIKDKKLDKYLKLSEDDINEYLHTPTKTLLCLINTPKTELTKIKNKEDYKNYILSLKKKNFTFAEADYNFKNSIIFNDYDTFLNKVINYIKFIEK